MSGSLRVGGGPVGIGLVGAIVGGRCGGRSIICTWYMMIIKTMPLTAETVTTTVAIARPFEMYTPLAMSVFYEKP